MLERDRVQISPAPFRHVRPEVGHELTRRVLEREGGEAVASAYRRIAGVAEPRVVRAGQELVQREDGTPVAEIVRIELVSKLVPDRTSQHPHEPRFGDGRAARLRGERAIPVADEGLRAT